MDKNIYEFEINEGPWAELSSSTCLYCYGDTIGYFSNHNYNTKKEGFMPSQKVRRFCADLECKERSRKQMIAILNEET